MIPEKHLPRQRNSLAAILADHGVTLVPTTKAGTRQRSAGKTCAAGTLQRLLDRHGEAHLRDVLTIIVETEGNAAALIAPVISGVSAALLAHREWYEADAGRFLQVVDRVDLLALYARAKRHRRAILPWMAVAMLLCEELEAAFEPEQQAA